MKFLFFLTSLLFIHSTALAQIASLSSTLCGKNRGFQSTAYVFNYQGRTLALAAADFVLNSSGADVCHQAMIPGLTVSLHLLKNDWGAGLALLEAASPVLQVPEIKWGKAQLAKKVMVGASSGLILATKSDRHHFPLQDSVLEVGRATLSRGNVGTPLLDYDHEDQVVGFISSQFVWVVASEGSKISRWVDTNLSSFDGPFIALSADSVKMWLDQTLAQPPQVTLFSLDVTAQLQGIQKINWGSLSFVEDCPPALSNGENASYPIGGGDPFGIGGTGRLTPPCKFNVTLAATTEKIENPLSARAPWLQEMKDLLNQKKVVDVYLAYQKLNNLLINKGLVSLGSFFKTIATSNLQFVLLVDPDRAANTMTPLQQKARELRTAVRAYPFDSSDHSFRNRAYLVALLLEGPDWNQVELQDLAVLKKDSPWVNYDTLIDGLTQELRLLKP